MFAFPTTNQILPQNPAPAAESPKRRLSPLSSSNLIFTTKASSTTSTTISSAAPGTSKHDELSMDLEIARSSTAGDPGQQGFDDDSIKRIHDEFEQLNLQYQADLNQQLQKGVMMFASATTRTNYHKNRYSNILATEATRVKLIAHRDLFLDSDYINANFIDGEIPGSKKTYIACQAPLPSTLSHFWLMLWESESAVIVMLTRLCERERVKATAYWPEDVGERKDFGPFCVTFVKGKIVSAYLEQRVFDVEFGGQTRQIVQLHYTEWPDFGTPESTQTIRELVGLMDVYRMKGKLSGLGGPIVTHCSAGVGRAGTFVAIHICLEKMKYFNSLDQVIDIPQTVMLLRQSRTGMVQTPEQYRFIYEVVRDARVEFKERAQRVFASPAPSELEGDFKRPHSIKRSKKFDGEWVDPPRSLRSSCAACYTVSSSMSLVASSPYAVVGESSAALEGSGDIFTTSGGGPTTDDRRKAFATDKKRRLSFSRS
jgi:protein tyrosine phosphatase